MHIGKLTNTSLYATGIKAQKKEPKRILDIVVRKCLRSKYQNSDDQDGEVREETRLHALQAFYPTQEPHHTKSNEQVNEQRSIKILAILAKNNTNIIDIANEIHKKKANDKKITEFLQKLVISNKERDSLEKSTHGQANNSAWKELQNGRITAAM